jgi:hypothetical protein
LTQSKIGQFVQLKYTRKGRETKVNANHNRIVPAATLVFAKVRTRVIGGSGERFHAREDTSARVHFSGYGRQPQYQPNL